MFFSSISRLFYWGIKHIPLPEAVHVHVGVFALSAGGRTEIQHHSRGTMKHLKQCWTLTHYLSPITMISLNGSDDHLMIFATNSV